MTTLNISLPENLRTFVEDQVASGGFGTASEYIRSLILEAQARDAVEERLLAAMEEEPEGMGVEDWKRL